MPLERRIPPYPPPSLMCARNTPSRYITFPRFEEKVSAFGKDRMSSEVSALRRANGGLREDCGFHPAAAARLPEEFRPWGPPGAELVGHAMSPAAPRWCRNHVLGELSFLDEIREEQGERAREAMVRQGLGGSRRGLKE